MATVICTLRSLSTRVPRPKNWRVSPFDAPRPVLAPPPPDSAPVAPLRPAPPSRPPGTPTPPQHKKHRLALKQAFPEGWSPPRKLSRDAMEGLRVLHDHSPETFTTPVLAERFKISPEAVRRILKSKWVPDKERRAELRLRDEKRKAERKRSRAQSEWAEGVVTGALKLKETRRKNDRLELT